MATAKIRTRIKYEDTRGVLIEDYPEYLLDLVSAPPHRTVSDVIFGYDDGIECMIVHFDPLTQEQFAHSDAWRYDFDAYGETYARRFADIAAAARKRWPEVRIFRVPGCLCCNGVQDLRRYDCEVKAIEFDGRKNRFVF